MLYFFKKNNIYFKKIFLLKKKNVLFINFYIISYHIDKYEYCKYV